MPKIVVSQNLDFTASQKERLKKLGDVTFYDDWPEDQAEWLKRVNGFEIIISGSFGLLQNLQNIKNCFVSVPFVALGQINKDELKNNKVTIANAPGCNKNAVSEWVIAMLLNLTRKFNNLINKISTRESLLEVTSGLNNKKILILGKGNIGRQVGVICDCFGMKVDYYLKDDDLVSKTKEADIIINCLSLNESTEGILNELFFKSIRKGSYFISISRQEIYDTGAMFKSLEDGTLVGLADDCSNEEVGDTTNNYYKKLIGYKNVLATPHIAWNTKAANELGNEMAIDNVEAWIKGEPINLMF